MRDADRICRLAIRKEGAVINAYIAQYDTMKNAKYIGSIAADLADAKPEIFAKWKDIMREAIEEFVFYTCKLNIEFGGEEKAPEHERAGSA